MLFHARFSQKIDDLISCPLKSNSLAHDQSSGFLSKIDKALQPNQFKPHVATQAIHDWLALGGTISKQSCEYIAWLETLGIAIYPFMPELSRKIQLMTSEKTYASI